MEVGALTAFLSYLMQILMSVMMGTFMLMMVPRASVSADRIAEVLDTDSSIAPPTAPVTEVALGRPPRPRGRGLHLSRSRGARCSTASRCRCARAGRSASSARPAPARRRWSTWCRDCSTPRPAGCSSTASTCATSTRSCSGRGSGWCPSGRSSSPAPLRPTSATATRTRPTTSCGGRSRSRRRPTSCGRCRSSWTRRSCRAAPTSPAGSGSGSRSPGRWCGVPRSTSSTTRSPRSTSPPTPGCGRPFAPR